MTASNWRAAFKGASTGFFFSLTVCVSCGAPLVFANTNFISINDSNNPPTVATPYPDTNLVAGLAGQVVTKATVTLQGFSHTYPSDVSVLLVGPGGQRAILMSAVGGTAKYSVTNLTLTFDDDATGALPVYGQLTSGTFRPTNGWLTFGDTNLPYDFPVPAPPGNSNSPSALAVFRNTDPTGTWKLFILDNNAGDAGSIANGWSLNLTVAPPLHITRSQTNVIISWPASATNCTLQVAPGFTGSIIWTNVAATFATNSGFIWLTNPASGGNKFYRLIGN